MDTVQRCAAAEIIPHGQILIQHGALEHHAQLAADAVRLLVQIGAADEDAAAVLAQLAAHDVDGGGFAGTVDAQKGEQLSLFHAKIQILHRLHCAKGLVKVADLHNIIHILSPFTAPQKFCSPSFSAR